MADYTSTKTGAEVDAAVTNVEDSGLTGSGGDATFSGNVKITGAFINFGTPSELTIASGVVTATKSQHAIDTEGDAASDDLDTINGGSDGDILIIRAANSSRTVVVKDATGNIQIGGDKTLDNAQDRLTLIYDASIASGAWVEITRANSGS